MLAEKFYVIAQIGHEVTLWILIVLSIISVAFIFERWNSLRKEKSAAKSLSHKIEDIIQTNKLEGIESLSSEKQSVSDDALKHGIKHIKSHGSEGLEEIFTSFANVKKTQLNKRLNFLATVGSNAPFIGLLGTVFGIMDAFKELALSQGEASAVMIGISKALIATAVGLLVAIPAVIAYNYFQKTVRQILLSLESTKDICLAFAKSKK